DLFLDLHRDGRLSRCRLPFYFSCHWLVGVLSVIGVRRFGWASRIRRGRRVRRTLTLTVLSSLASPVTAFDQVTAGKLGFKLEEGDLLRRLKERKGRKSELNGGFALSSSTLAFRISRERALLAGRGRFPGNDPSFPLRTGAHFRDDTLLR